MQFSKRITSQNLRVPSLDGLTDFYADVLGMQSVVNEPDRCSFLAGPGSAQLVFHRADVTPFEAQPNDFYWKTGITVRDLDSAATHLRSHGIHVPQPAQFRDIGYLTKIVDPNGFNIELLQQGFKGNPKMLDAGNPIGTQATLAHITLRVTDIAASEAFFVGTLGMRLMSVQPVDEFSFCLYFYAWSDEELPDPDLESVANREWLWERPYTLVELQHLQADDASVRLLTKSSAGFAGFGYRDPDTGQETLVSTRDIDQVI